MVTEYNRNVLMRRRAEEAERRAKAAAEAGANDATAPNAEAAGAKPADTAPSVAEADSAGGESNAKPAVETDERPRKTDAEKLKKGRR